MSASVTKSEAPAQPKPRSRRPQTIKTDDVKIPIAEGAESSVLGAILMDEKGLPRAMESGLTREHFGIPSNAIIFGAMNTIHLNGGVINPQTLTDYLKTHHKLDEVGGIAYISALIDGKAPSLTMIGGLVHQLNEVRLKRMTLRGAVRLQEMAQNGASITDIEELIDALPRGNTTSANRYVANADGLHFRRVGKYGVVELEKLANFTAQIVSEQIEDDGSLEELRIFELECELKGRKSIIRVPASKFSTMTWPTQQLGAEAILYPGRGEHARVAIQSVSRNIRQLTVYTHTGWRQIENIWSYLHSGGAITPTDNRTDVAVRLPESLRFYHFPVVPAAEKKAKAFLYVLSLVNAFPKTVTVPLIGAAFAAILGNSDYSIFVTGQSGTRKSEITSLVQAFFGSGFNRLALPSSYVDSALAILQKAFKAKDAVIVIDDFAPNGQKHHDDKLHATAETIFRAAGNAAGRDTAKVDHTLRGAKPPRGMLISSGEDVPRGGSLQNRLLIIPLKLGDVPDEPLTQMQALAREGKLAESMAVFIQHVATYKTTVERLFKSDCIRYRQLIASTNKQHSRQPTTIAHLCATWRAWLRCGVMIGAFTRTEARVLWKKIWEAMTAALEEQKAQQTTMHPADYFLELLRSALVSGRCHLATIDGAEPEINSSLLGWRSHQPQGDLAGWIEDGLIYLEPAAAYKASNNQGLSLGEALPVGPKSLWVRMDEKKYLVKKEPGKGLRARTPRTRLWTVVISETAIFN